MSQPDEVFQRFAARLADAVTVAINSGKRIVLANAFSPSNCLCPLGCLPGMSYRFPWSNEDARRAGISYEDFRDFITAFGRGTRAAGPYADLGLEYRRRFVREAA